MWKHKVNFSFLLLIINCFFFFCIYSTINKWVFTLKAETLKAPIQHSNSSLSHFFQTKKKKPISFSHPTFRNWPGDTSSFSMSTASLLCVPLPLSLMLCPEAAPPRLSSPHPHYPAVHSLLNSTWHRWRGYGQSTFEGVRLMCGVACGSRVALCAPPFCSLFLSDVYRLLSCLYFCLHALWE